MGYGVDSIRKRSGAGEVVTPARPPAPTVLPLLPFRQLLLPSHRESHLRCSRSCRSGSCFFHPIASRTYGAPAPAVPAVASSIPSRVAPTVLPLLPFRQLLLPSHRESHLRCSRSCRSGSCFFHPIASRTYGAPAPAVPAVASSIPSRVAPTVLPLLPFRQLLLPSHRESHLRCSRSCRSGSCFFHPIASRTYGAPAPAVPAVASSIPSRVAPTVLPLLPFRQLLLPSHRESHLRCSRSCRSGSRDQHDLPVHGIRNLRVL